MRLFLTGATGFVGRTLLLRCLAEGRYDEIFCPVRDPEKLRRQLAREGVVAPDRLRILRAEAPDWDFRSLGAVDHLVHCAGVLFSRRRNLYFDVNVEGTLNLMARLPGAPRAVLLSSQSAGGPTPPGVAARTAAHQDRPLSWYGASKLRMEQRVAESMPHQPVLLLRAPMVLGPGDQATLPLFRMVRRTVWPKPGVFTKELSWVDSDDLADAILCWLLGADATSGVQKHYVTSPGSISDVELLRTAAEVSFRGGATLRVPQCLLRPVAWAATLFPEISQRVPSLTPDRAREIWPRRWVVDGSSFEDCCGWRGRADLRRTLARTLEWYQREGLV